MSKAPKALINKLFGGEADHVWGTEVTAVAFPPETMPEVAVIGRSNVGKSTLINALLNRKKLARTSSKPGATRAVHFYEVAKSFHLVDLPGYGYAKLSKEMSAKLAQLIYEYFSSRRNLKKAYVLIDSRRGVKEVDLEILEILEEVGVPTKIIFTKGDKAKQVERDKAVQSAEMQLGSFAHIDRDFIQTSSETSFGIDDLRQDIISVCGLR